MLRAEKDKTACGRWPLGSQRRSSLTAVTPGTPGVSIPECVRYWVFTIKCPFLNAAWVFVFVFFCCSLQTRALPELKQKSVGLFHTLSPTPGISEPYGHALPVTTLLHSVPGPHWMPRHPGSPKSSTPMDHLTFVDKEPSDFRQILVSSPSMCGNLQDTKSDQLVAQ